MSDELTKTSAVTALVPTGLDDLIRFAKMVSGSGVAGTRKVEEAAFLISYGLELGITPIKAVQSLHLIKGKVTMSADMMVSLCLRDPRCEYIEVAESSAQECTYRAKRVGRPEQKFTFTMQMAKRAGIAGGDNWRKYPEAMLKARAGSHIARQVFPDIVMGIYDPDEIQNVGTAEVVDAVPEVEEQNEYDVLRGKLAKLATGYFVEFEEALVAAKGDLPDEKTLRAVIAKLEGMERTARGEWMQEQIDKYLNAAPLGEEPAEAVDAEFEPVEGAA